jgi:hypothetical protein
VPWSFEYKGHTNAHWTAGQLSSSTPQKRLFPYRLLVEQIPAVVFLAFLEKGISEAYVSPQIEHTLGFTQEP